jgi:transcriptional regulator with XRE-family HTH domain
MASTSEPGPSASAPEPVDARVRRRLHEIRSELGLTLQQVADRAAIDVSTLSRLETGKRRIALDHLPVLASALGVTTDELIGSTSPHDPRVRGEPREFDGLTLWPLTRRGAAGLQAYKASVSPARDRPPSRLPVHEGHDWLYVLSGRLRLVLGAQDLVIEPGEAAEFSTLEPHWFGAVDGPVELILMVGPQGERVHLWSAGADVPPT